MAIPAGSEQDGSAGDLDCLECLGANGQAVLMWRRNHDGVEQYELVERQAG